MLTRRAFLATTSAMVAVSVVPWKAEPPEPPAVPTAGLQSGWVSDGDRTWTWHGVPGHWTFSSGPPLTIIPRDYGE